MNESDLKTESVLNIVAADALAAMDEVVFNLKAVKKSVENKIAFELLKEAKVEVKNSLSDYEISAPEKPLNQYETKEVTAISQGAVKFLINSAAVECEKNSSMLNSRKQELRFGLSVFKPEEKLQEKI
jgi:hypothetical protein